MPILINGLVRRVIMAVIDPSQQCHEKSAAWQGFDANPPISVSRRNNWPGCKSGACEAGLQRLYSGFGSDPWRHLRQCLARSSDRSSSNVACCREGVFLRLVSGRRRLLAGRRMRFELCCGWQILRAASSKTGEARQGGEFGSFSIGSGSQFAQPQCGWSQSGWPQSGWSCRIGPWPDCTASWRG